MAIELTVTFLLGLLASWLIIPRLLKASCSRKMLDHPNARKIHKGDIPRVGGIAIFLSSLISITAVSAYILVTGNATFNLQGGELPLLVVSLLFLSVFGVIDDMHGLRYRMKFLGQIMAGVLMCASGLWLGDLHGLFGVNEVSPAVGWSFTVLAVVCVTNAINFIDGIDGLASSLCGLAIIYFAYLFICDNLLFYAIVCLALVGALLPFIWYNMMGTTADRTKLFMGDTGSLILGLILCAFGVVVCNNPNSAHCDYNPMVLAFAPLILPCYDVIRVVYNRALSRHNLFEADKGHIHHKYLKLGKSQHFSLVAIIVTAAVMTLSAVVLTLWVNINVVLIIEMAFWCVYNMMITALIKHNKTENK